MKFVKITAPDIDFSAPGGVKFNDKALLQASLGALLSEHGNATVRGFPGLKDAVVDAHGGLREAQKSPRATDIFSHYTVNHNHEGQDNLLWVLEVGKDTMMVRSPHADGEGWRRMVPVKKIMHKVTLLLKDGILDGIEDVVPAAAGLELSCPNAIWNDHSVDPRTGKARNKQVPPQMWHTDLPPCPDGGVELSFFVAVEDCRIWIISQSHKLTSSVYRQWFNGLITDDELFVPPEESPALALQEQKRINVPEQYTPAELILKAGDLLVMDAALLHGGAPNLNPKKPGPEMRVHWYASRKEPLDETFPAAVYGWPVMSRLPGKLEPWLPPDSSDAEGGKPEGKINKTRKKRDK
jgi:ectoine hydroxylase-related dioxygenase (phytanoyl-CoA dioxygenase family)